MKYLLQFIIIISIIGISQPSISQVLEDKIIGKWAMSKDPIGYVIISNDRTYEEYLSINFIRKGTWTIENGDLVIEVYDSPYNAQDFQVIHPIIKYMNINVIDDILIYTSQENVIFTMHRSSTTNISSNNKAERSLEKNVWHNHE